MGLKSGKRPVVLEEEKDKGKKMKYSTYIFDLDGTLLNTIEDLAISCNAALAQFGMPQYSVEQVKGFVGNGVRKLMERSVPQGESNPLFEEIFAAFKSHYLKHGSDHTAPYPGITEMVDTLIRRGRNVAVVSNKFNDATRQLVARYFGDRFPVAVGESEKVRRKPAPDMVMEALRQLGAAADEAVYVGDSDVDIDTAKNCNIPCASVLWGFRSKEFLLEHGATTLVASPTELLQL